MTDPGEHVWHYSYDAANRLVATTMPNDFNDVQFRYGRSGRVVLSRAYGIRNSFEYSRARTVVTDAFAGDNHRFLVNDFRTPDSSAAYTGPQYYRYRCSGQGGSWTTIFGPLHVEVRPGDRLTRTLLLNERADFTEPGRYEVLITLPSPVTTREGAELMKVPAHRERFEVLPRNAAKLTEACESLLRQIASSPSAVVSEDAALALAHIQDAVAVPYMEKALRTGETPGTSLVDGLARMGTANAVRALVSVYTDLSSTRSQADSWNRRRANAIREGLESIEARTSDAATKAEIHQALGSTPTQRR